MKSCIAILLLIAFFSIQGKGQGTSPTDLVLTGSVMDVKITSDRRTAAPDDQLYEIHLYLQFRNNTNDTLIILPPRLLDGSKIVSFQHTPSVSVSSSSSATVIPQLQAAGDATYLPNNDPVSILISYLRRSQSTSLIRIQPHGYYEGGDTIIVSNGFKTETRKSGKSTIKVAVAEYPALTIRYKVATTSRPGMADALASAKERWRGDGTLFLNNSGDYDITSELILNKLSE